jgi:hypothetical protein
MIMKIEHFFNEFTEIAKNEYLLTELIINALFPMVMDISTQKMKTLVHDDFSHELMMLP